MSNIIILMALLSFLTITDGMSPGEQGVNLRCQCINMEKRPIGRHIEKMEIIPANSHCEDIQIIVTLKKTGTKVCLNPEARWVKRILEKIKRQQNGRKHRTSTDSAHK